MRFEGKTAISTGAASGMGLLFSEMFAREGGNVVMCDVNEPVLMEKAAAINAEGNGHAIACVTDVRDYTQVCAARDLCVREFGAIDIMANFAGGAAVRILKVAPELEFPDIPIDVYDWGIDVNLKGAFYFDHAVLKQMREQKSGLIINLGSVTGVEGDPRDPSYAVSKSALMIGLTRSLARYGSNYGIRCVCVAPGPVLTRPAMANMKTMMHRAAEPKEIIDLIFYLATEGQFIDGEYILIDGGRYAAGRDQLL